MAKIPTDYDFNMGDDVTLMVEGTITKEEFEDNQDGTCDKIVVFKGIVAEKNDE